MLRTPTGFFQNVLFSFNDNYFTYLWPAIESVLYTQLAVNGFSKVELQRTCNSAAPRSWSNPTALEVVIWLSTLCYQTVCLQRHLYSTQAPQPKTGPDLCSAQNPCPSLEERPTPMNDDRQKRLIDSPSPTYHARTRHRRLRRIPWEEAREGLTSRMAWEGSQ